MLAQMSVENPVRCAVLGAGSFGTCLAILLAEKGHQVDLWARDAQLVDAIEKARRNPRYLTDFALPDAIRPTTSLRAGARRQGARDLGRAEPRGARGLGKGARAGPPRRPDRLRIEGDRGRHGQARLRDPDGDAAARDARPALLPVRTELRARRSPSAGRPRFRWRRETRPTRSRPRL